MRKLLILMLVLGIAPWASATISFVSNSATVNVGESVTVSVSSDTSGAAWTGYLGYTPGLASLTGVVATANAGSDAAVSAAPYGYTGYFKLDATDFSPPPDSIVAGTQFTGNLVAGMTEGTYTINLWGSSWDSGPLADSFTLTIVPEPMTMALLGLGGLLLRRRK